MICLLKTRWFKLEGGELRYYTEANMRPSSLKQTVILIGCSINEAESKNRSIVLNLAESSVDKEDANALCMEAATKEIAADWKKALQDTIDALGAKSITGKARRANVANETSDVISSDALPVRFQALFLSWLIVLF